MAENTFTLILSDMKKSIIISLFIGCLFVMKVSAQTTPAPPVPFSISDSAAYVGKYKFEGMPFEYMEISVKDGKLFFSGGEYSGPLLPMKDKPDVFDANGAAVFSFARNPEKKITDLGIDYQGQAFSGKKEEKKDPAK